MEGNNQINFSMNIIKKLPLFPLFIVAFLPFSFYISGDQPARFLIKEKPSWAMAFALVAFFYGLLISSNLTKSLKIGTGFMFVGMACFCTFSNGQITWLIWANSPWIGSLYVLLGLIFLGQKDKQVADSQ